MASPAYRDAINEVETTATIATRSETGGGLAVAGTGRVRGDPLAFQLTAGSPEQVTKGTEPLPVRGEFTLAGTRATVDGVLRDPVAFGGLDLAIGIASDDPGPLLVLAGRPSKATVPALRAGARLTKDAKSIGLEDLRASWGDTQIEGRAQFDTSGSRLHVDAELRAPVLDLVQLSQMVSADGAEPAQATPSAADPESAQATSGAGNPLKALAGYEGELRISANTIRVQPDLALTDAAATLNLADGRLRIAPLRIGLPTGQLAGEITTGPLAAEQLTVDLRLQAENAGVADLAGYGGRVDGVLEGTLVVGPPQAILAGSRIRFEGRGDGLKIPGADLGSLTVTAALQDGHLRLDPLQAKLPQGEIAGRVTAGPFDNDFSAELDLDAAKVDLAAAARSDLIGGLLDGHVTGTLHGATARDMLTRSQLQLDGTIAELRLPQLERPLTRVKLAVKLDPNQREALHIAVDASADDRPLQLSVFGGSVESIAENRGDYPFTVHSELGKNTVDINGTVSLPLTERKFAATVKAEGPDPSPILALFELPKLQIPPYRVSGVLTNRGDELRIKSLDGRVGDSDVAADLTVSFGGERPKLSGQVTSKLLDGDDLGGLVGAQPGTGPGETASPGQNAEAVGEKRKGTVLPDERLDPARWRKGDVDLALRFDEIRAGKIPLDGFTGQLTLVDGLLRLEPLDLRVGDGHLTGRIEIDGRHDPVGADVALDMKRLSVARLMRRLDVDMATFGTLVRQCAWWCRTRWHRLQHQGYPGQIQRRYPLGDGRRPDQPDHRCWPRARPAAPVRVVHRRNPRDGRAALHGGRSQRARRHRGDTPFDHRHRYRRTGRRGYDRPQARGDRHLPHRAAGSDTLADGPDGNFDQRHVGRAPARHQSAGPGSARCRRRHVGGVAEAIHGGGGCSCRCKTTLRSLARPGPRRERRLADQLVDESVVVAPCHARDQHCVDQPP